VVAVTERTPDLSAFTLDSFAPLVGEAFVVDAGTERLRLVLRGAAGRRGSITSFALSFAGPPAPALPQATYRFTHESLGSFDLFICPVARTADGLTYEAVFNRLPLRRG
jgi:uncharacterized protein DUF6916